MLRLDLGRLGREPSVVVEGEIPATDPQWEDSGLAWAGPVTVRLRASYAGTGELVVRGNAAGRLQHQCRRCLKPVAGTVDEDLTMVFVEKDGPELEEDAGDVYVFEPKGSGLDLSEAVREELILAIDPYVVCDAKCKGLCPVCGTNRNAETCSCTTAEPDSRWDALRALKDK